MTVYFKGWNSVLMVNLLNDIFDKDVFKQKWKSPPFPEDHQVM